MSRSFQNSTDYFERLVKRSAGFCLGSGGGGENRLMAGGMKAKDHATYSCVGFADEQPALLPNGGWSDCVFHEVMPHPI